MKVGLSHRVELVKQLERCETVKLWDVQSGVCVATFDHRLYAGLKIQGVKGLSRAEILTLKALGAVE